MKVSAAKALIEELVLWDVDHVYGIPGSSLNGMMAALSQSQDKMKYIQVRHESAGSMAASAEYKLSGKIGVAFGSAGPGSTNLINGLYDAKMDRAPMLALVGQTASVNQNTMFFQETEIMPLFENVSVYNRKATNADQIPYMVNDAIRTAYEQKGPAIVILPNDLMEEEIDYIPTSGATKIIPKAKRFEIEDEKVENIADRLKNAKNPVLYLGRGVMGHMDQAIQVAEQFNLPVVTTGSSIGLSFPANHPNFMGSFGRVGTKPANEAIEQADIVLFVGASLPFARYWKQSNPEIKVIQVNNSFREIGRQIAADDSIVADSGDFFDKLLATGVSRDETPELRAARRNMKSWREYLEHNAYRGDNRIYYETVLKEINKHANEDAIFAVGVGNNTLHSARLLELNGTQNYTMSGWFATLGYSTPASIGAQLQFPDRQVFSIVGDGGYAMNMQEIVTQTKYHLPIINVVVTDSTYSFIKHAQLERYHDEFGVDIMDADWAKTAEGMGAIAFSVRTVDELQEAFDKAKKLYDEGIDQPIFIEAKAVYEDPLDTSHLTVNPDRYSREEIDAYLKENNIEDLPILADLIEEERQ